MSEDKKEFSLEQNLRDIRALLQEMQTGSQDFDENIRLFRQGTKLIKASRNYLDEAELSIKQLIESEGEMEEVDFK
ncbi:MAG TPA: exodeoxyribonuclease VII small subunit [Bacteroidetes bacterium]|nr:exodeoxyribonuclease VII small subunit [Bacteroidota bacterium]